MTRDSTRFMTRDSARMDMAEASVKFHEVVNNESISLLLKSTNG